MRYRLAEFLDVFYGYRKFIAFMTIMLVAIIFRLYNYIDGNNFTSMINTTFAAFAAGNMTEHFTTAVKQYMNNKNVSTLATNLKDAIKDGGPTQ